jgi:CRISPR/Cas system-associated protein Cas10 (large subunit of type III CRISPR-Cas system)
MESRKKISKKYYEKNKDKIRENRKRIDVECPICKSIRSVRTDSKRITDNCNICSIRKIRVDKGDILHNLTGHPLYIRWASMKRRVKDPFKRNSYLDKNITVCDEWNDNFLPFFEWSIANNFSPELELDRIDNNGNYCPENCRWITHYENCQNR